MQRAARVLRREARATSFPFAPPSRDVCRGRWSCRSFPGLRAATCLSGSFKVAAYLHDGDHPDCEHLALFERKAGVPVGLVSRFRYRRPGPNSRAASRPFQARREARKTQAFRAPCGAREKYSWRPRATLVMLGIPKFAPVCRTLRRELRKPRDTRNSMRLVPL